MIRIIITAILFTSLTVNVMTYWPRCQPAQQAVQVASYQPPDFNIKAILHDLDKARGAK